MTLEPNIDQLCEFSAALVNNSSSSERGREVPSVMRELLAQSVKLEDIRAAHGSSAVDAAGDGGAGGGGGKQQSSSSSNRKNQARAKMSKEEEHAKRVEELVAKEREREGQAAAGIYSPKAKNETFLGRSAAQAKEARFLKRKAGAGVSSGVSSSSTTASSAKGAKGGAGGGGGDSKRLKLCHSGSGEFLCNVARYKFQKGFTQAVRHPVKLIDLLS
jgi:hypothetical protein